ncbi:sensor domain-containing protein [Mycobacterium barrassiae]|uniref:sensor domain-containing protein n=1 Tax=Mycobacterium barrassiae TaxID=319709 RepID=UPI0022659CBF|nr:sensor domain-containing protein [Mycobacterium barrassiae]MCV7300511.1 sensor domain-containing protein [Mycobacterium barrassiae]
MPAAARLMTVWGAAALLAVGCTQSITGTAVRAIPGIDDDSLSPVDVETVVLDQSQMRAITGAGEDLSIIPSMDGKFPVDIEPLVKGAPPQCEWLFAETQTFGREVEEFRKTTFQNPPDGGLISEAVAAYRSPEVARAAFDSLAGLVDGCGSSTLGPDLVGQWTVADDMVRTRPGACGRDYRVKSVVLVEVTFCRFPGSVPDIVMTNILANVPE